MSYVINVITSIPPEVKAGAVAAGYFALVKVVVWDPPPVSCKEKDTTPEEGVLVILNVVVPVSVHVKSFDKAKFKSTVPDREPRSNLPVLYVVKDPV